MTNFCKSRGIERELVCFMYNGVEILEIDTPKSIGLKAGDDIVVFDRLFIYFSALYFSVYMINSFTYF